MADIFSQSIPTELTSPSGSLAKPFTSWPLQAHLTAHIYSARSRFLAGHLLDLFENASLMTRVLGEDGKSVVVDTSGAKDGVRQVIRGMWGKA